MGKKLNLIGETFNRWTVIEKGKGYISPGGKKKSTWVCECECGNTKEVLGMHLKSNKSKSCGCLQKDIASKTHTKHGQSRSKEYKAWIQMKQRCHNPNDTGFTDYGARGIKVCDRWLNSFNNFLSDMGKAPSKSHTIERVNVDGNYKPDNCIWLLGKYQARNTRYTKLTPTLVKEIRDLKSKGYTYEELSKMYNAEKSTIRSAVIGNTWKDIV